MAVFFSTTDDEELIDNSQFHNYYLSIIVNNRNDITGKIAFRGKSTSETKTLVTFKDTNGNEKVREYIGKVEDEAVYTYGCIIVFPEIVEDDFNLRFLEILEIEKKKKAEAEKKRQEQMTAKSNVVTVGKGAYGGFDGAKRYREANLWEDVQDGGYGNTEDWMEESKRKKTEIKKKSVKDSGPVDSRVYGMLAKLLKLDHLYEGTLGKVLEGLNHQFYSSSEKTDPNYYYDQIVKRSVTFYIENFPEDQNLLRYDKVMGSGIELLNLSEEYYPKLVPSIIEALKETITDE